MKAERIVKKARSDVKSLIPGANIPKIKIVKRKNDAHLREHKSTVGYYHSVARVIVLCKEYLEIADKKSVYKAACHEIGHAIHHQYLDFRAQYLPRKHGNDQSLYCNTNQKESFAECFADCVYALSKGKSKKIADSKRLSKMMLIIKGVGGNVDK